MTCIDQVAHCIARMQGQKAEFTATVSTLSGTARALGHGKLGRWLWGEVGNRRGSVLEVWMEVMEGALGRGPPSLCFYLHLSSNGAGSED